MIHYGLLICKVLWVPYSLNSCIHDGSECGWVNNTNKSIAYNASLFWVFLICTLFIFWLSLILLAKCSITNAYRMGKSGHPCLVPLFSFTSSESWPFTLTLARVCWYETIILLNTFGPRWRKSFSEEVPVDHVEGLLCVHRQGHHGYPFVFCNMFDVFKAIIMWQTILNVLPFTHRLLWNQL